MIFCRFSFIFVILIFIDWYRKNIFSYFMVDITGTLTVVDGAAWPDGRSVK